MMSQVTAENKTKILFIDEAVAFGGSVVVLSHLIGHLDRSKFTPLLVTSLDAGSVAKLFRPEDVLCRFHPPMSYASRARWMARCPVKHSLVTTAWAYAFTVVSKIANFPQHFRLYRSIKQARPAILHHNNGREGLIAARRFGIPLVFHLHGMWPQMLYEPFDTRPYASVYVSISKHISTLALQFGVPPEKLVDVPNPAPVAELPPGSREAWRKKLGLPADAVVLAHIGRLVRWKGQVEFIEAFARIAAQAPHAVALIVGDDVEGLESEYPEQLRQLAKERGLQSQMRFTGHIEDILGLMSAADIVVHSSTYPEPFGLVITEAMAVGSAVIAASRGAPLEIIDDGVTGLLVDPDNADEFGAGLLRLISDSALRERVSAAGKRRALDVYSPQSIARRFEELYTKYARVTS